VLRDPAGLARDDLRLADRVEQRGLAVVDVAMIVTTGGRSIRSPRRPRRRARLDVVGGVDDLDFLVELVGQDLDGVIGERLRQRRHLPSDISFLMISGTATPRYSRRP